ncbi:MAG TPA: hypothetical protein VEK56_02230 [Vicinamibacterales bacterium]|nr:hypothetical protein [Vicinamibacterales bacterium]
MESTSRRRAHVASSEGIALIALVIVLGGLIAAVLFVSPQILLGITVSKEEETRRQLALLVRAIAGIPGNPDGFVSDVGRLPKSLEEVNSTSGTQTLCDAAFNPSVVNSHLVDGSTEHRGHMSMGWNGPYMKEIFAAGDFLVDAWGQKLQYTCPQTTKPATDPTTNGLALMLRTGQITSAGADGAFGTQDDIVSDTFNDNGHVFLTITTGNSATPTSITVSLFYPLNGEQTSQSTAPTTLDTSEGSQKLLVFQSVPAGIRFVDITMDPKSESVHLQYNANVSNAATYVIPIH